MSLEAREFIEKVGGYTVGQYLQTAWEFRAAVLERREEGLPVEELDLLSEQARIFCGRAKEARTYFNWLIERQERRELYIHPNNYGHPALRGKIEIPEDTRPKKELGYPSGIIPKENIVPLDELEDFGLKHIAYRGIESVIVDQNFALRCPTLQSVMEVSFVYIANQYKKRGQAGADEKILEIFKRDYPRVIEAVIKARNLPEEQIPPILRQVVKYISRNLILGSLTDDELRHIYYRTPVGLELLSQHGVMVNPNRIDPLAALFQEEEKILIPTDKVAPATPGSKLHPHEILAVAALLRQLGARKLNEMGLRIKYDQFKELIDIQRATHSSSGKLKEPAALAELYGKLIDISNSGYMSSVDLRTTGASELADLFTGVERSVLEALLSNSISAKFLKPPRRREIEELDEDEKPDYGDSYPIGAKEYEAMFLNISKK